MSNSIGRKNLNRPRELKEVKKLCYCSNVHAINDFIEWENTMSYFGTQIRQHMQWANLPMGLWFHAGLMQNMDAYLMGKIRDILAAYDLSVFTLNAFPYGRFHEPVVKTKVYIPDWTRPERLEYTVGCAKLLAYLVKDNMGSISTLPLGWREGWTERHSQMASHNLLTFVKEARSLENKTGKCIRLGLEPEPGCVLEYTEQVLLFWEKHVRPMAHERGISPNELSRYLGICYDTCHQAVQFEAPEQVISWLIQNEIPIVKMQLSSALEFKADPEKISFEMRQLFVEARFLHQTRIKNPHRPVGYDDLPQALADPELSWQEPWRVHYHLPIQAQTLGNPGDTQWIGTTRADMLKACQIVLEKNLCDHFEVETYTWNVLPEEYRPRNAEELAKSIAAELQFVLKETSLKETLSHA